MQTLKIELDKPEVQISEQSKILDLVTNSFKKIAPFWSLKNLIAVNPLQGFEDLPIEEALKLSASYFQQQTMPKEIEDVNRETIKWLQVYLDDNQATIQMPFRKHGLYSSWRKIAVFDIRLHKNNKHKQTWLKNLPKTSEQAIAECLLSLSVTKEHREQFLTLMLTTLPGWASYIKYRTDWSGLDNMHPYDITQADYLALRLIITTLLWPEAKILLDIQTKFYDDSRNWNNVLKEMEVCESAYRIPLLKQLALQQIRPKHIPEAQFVFCIDVRSEPFRKELESTGDYHTLGFAGFFGVAAQIINTITNESYSSCPVLLSPQHQVKESPCSHSDCIKDRKGYEKLLSFKKTYQSLKYTFTTPFALVESFGILSALLMGLNTFTPSLAAKIKLAAINFLRKKQELTTSVEAIPLKDRTAYAQAAIKMMGISQFAKTVILCGHGSETQNNAYATALDCGACGGRRGASNARILATIFNQTEVREQLLKNGIIIPDNTSFIAAEHNTATDELVLFNIKDCPEIKKIKTNLHQARIANSLYRLKTMQKNCNTINAISTAQVRAQDWAQVRPEWGLARNAAFIVAPRDLTASLDLKARCFLHSYDYQNDQNGSWLVTILTAPMVVAQWINAQYLFSTIDNTAFGAGSKITKNITGKIGIMQGNASDLMSGLPLQSVYITDKEPYHEPQRLMTVVYAPRQMLDDIIDTQPVLQKLFGNGWVQLACIEPDSRNIYLLNRDLSWQKVS